MTDVNYLLLRQQIALVQASRAASPESRAAHEGLARGYGDRVRDYRIENSRAFAPPAA
jgi:hypothetical protein